TRLRFLTRGVPIVTITLMVINIAAYLIGGLLAGNLFAPVQQGFLVQGGTGILVGAPNPLYAFGVQQGLLIQNDPTQIYRIVTAMFLHENIAHIGLNMVSLYFVGVITERIFGPGRFLLIYFAAGILGGLAQAFILPTEVALGASGAIFGIFGAFGAFALIRRQAFGTAGGAVISQWLFWLAINIYFTLSNSSSIGVYDHFVGLAAGLVFGALAVTTARRRRSVSP
ncbi:MAG: rhomboid family intramembrane serine protease, partial [Ktedonobacterales bacterium]|nr:rhomboid family intramembrane serine protease [Ktedonobacterales bacterium]